MMLSERPYWTTRIAKNLIIMRLLCFGSLVIAIPPLAYGQVERASLAGTVTDNSGAVLPGVAIKVTNEATNTSVNLETDTAGDYRAVNLTPGSTCCGRRKPVPALHDERYRPAGCTGGAARHPA